MAPILAADRPLPETQSLSPAQYKLVLHFLVIAAFALFASFLYSWTSRNEVSARYRPTVLASLIITAVAAVSYVVLILKVDSGYDRVGASYRPNPEALLAFAPRYMDWSVTVPLLGGHPPRARLGLQRQEGRGAAAERQGGRVTAPVRAGRPRWARTPG
jgi:Bacteriorhodopsin-like protein